MPRPCTPDGTLIDDDKEEYTVTTRNELLSKAEALEAEARKLREEAEKLPKVREMPGGSYIVGPLGDVHRTPYTESHPGRAAGVYYSTSESAEHAGPELAYIRKVQRWLADCGGEGPKEWSIACSDGDWFFLQAELNEPTAKGNMEACRELCRRLNAGEVVL